MKQTLSERLAIVGEILAQLSASPLPSQHLQTIVDYLPTVLHSDFLGVCLLLPDGSGYALHALAGLAGGALPNRLWGLDEGLAGQVIAENRLVAGDDLSPETAVSEIEQTLLRFGLTSVLVAPLQQGETAPGALYLAAKGSTPYDSDDVQIGRLLATGLASALESARLYQALADERSTMAAVLGSTEDGMLMFNEEGFVLLANPALHRMFGVPANALLGQPLTLEVGGKKLLDLLLGVGQQYADLTLPDGRFVQANVVQVQSEFGETVGKAAVFRDVTIFKELEQMKNEFVATVSHDLKNPIATIMLATDLLPMQGELVDSQKLTLSRITETAVYMNELVMDLLDLGKIEAGLEMSQAPILLPKLLRTVLAQLYPQAEAKRQEITADLAEQATVLGDEGRLRQLLLNLINNAIKYTPEGGEVTVSLIVKGDTIILQISDSGIGIPARDLPHIFDKFYRVSHESTKEIKGTGLGLAIVKSIVEAHNGRILVASEVGYGSTFTVYLPLEQRELA